ncbi:uncharacterized protein LOC124119892 isoform X3 [Haliotis rufescens]|uniref:uncharacterized protein LOC124119892 isoform X3 n=1 Tax=Haliotis rufescens TaxID=6454 RepID=UPI00201F772C|nr:uncharacterized protein LOC124119892 isoform X3 [Haliotis rufescens]
MCYPRVSLPHILTLVFLLPHPGALGCDPSFQMSVQDKVMYSKVVAQGTIVKHYPVTTANPGQFVAELEVQCVFKDTGTRLPGLLNITNGGSNPGKCFNSVLTVGEDYVVFLRIPGTHYEAHTLEVKVTDAAFSEVKTACGMKFTEIYPEGLTDVTAKHKCPDVKNTPCPTTTPYVPTHRTKHPPPRTTTTTTTTTTTSSIQGSTKLATQGGPKITKRVTMETVTISTTERSGSRNNGAFNIQTVILSFVIVFICYRV